MSTKTTNREITLTIERATRLSELAKSHQTSEDEVIEKALDLFFNVADFFDVWTERQAWYRLSDASLNRLWDNEQDAAYDNWREMYGASEG